MVLRDILYKVNIRSVTGSTGIEIKDIQIDSRKIKPGSLFIAIKGAAVDGYEFIEKAIEQGAVAIVCEKMPSVKKKRNSICAGRK